MRVKLNQTIVTHDWFDNEYSFKKGTEFDVVEAFEIVTLHSGKEIEIPNEMFDRDELRGIFFTEDGSMVKNEDIKIVEHFYEVQTLDKKWKITVGVDKVDIC